jgi:hypothetical protein
MMAFALAVLALIPAVLPDAQATIGDLHAVGCVDAGGTSCSAGSPAVFGSTIVGLAETHVGAVDVYALGTDSSSLTRSIQVLSRDTATQALTPGECLGGSGCRAVTAQAVLNGVGRDYGVQPIAISPDGTEVYVVGTSGILSFARDTATGALTEQRCTANDATNGCDVASAPVLNHLWTIAVAKTGVVVVGSLDGTIATLTPGPAGALTLAAHDTLFGSPSSGNPAELSVSSSGGELIAANTHEVSDYALGSNGSLTKRSCLTNTSNAAAAGCTGSDSWANVGKVESVALRGDGTSIYVGTPAYLLALARNASTAALSYAYCQPGTNGCLADTGGDGPIGIDSTDGYLYAANGGFNASSHTLAWMDLAPGQQSVFGGCISTFPSLSCPDLGEPANTEFFSMVLTADNNAIYASTHGGAFQLVELRRESTNPTGPDATTLSATNLTTGGSATIRGAINPNGYNTSYRFDWGTDTSYGNVAPASPAAAGADYQTHVFSQPLTGLTRGITYHYRIVAIGPSGEIDGSDSTFVIPLDPSAVTGDVTDLGYTQATLHGVVNPHGSHTKWEFQILDDPCASESCWEHATTIPVPPGDAGSGTGDEAVSQTISGLTPGHTYAYRLVAIGQLTTVVGNAAGLAPQFTTPLNPPPVPSEERIAFARGSSVFTMRASDGGGVRQVLAQLGKCNLRARFPIQSPNGALIAFSAQEAPGGSTCAGSTSSSAAGLWLMRADGTHLQQVSASDTGRPVWSPDGSTLAFLQPQDTVVGYTDHTCIEGHERLFDGPNYHYYVFVCDAVGGGDAILGPPHDELVLAHVDSTGNAVTVTSGPWGPYASCACTTQRDLGKVFDLLAWTPGNRIIASAAGGVVSMGPDGSDIQPVDLLTDALWDTDHGTHDNMLAVSGDGTQGLLLQTNAWNSGTPTKVVADRFRYHAFGVRSDVAAGAARGDGSPSPQFGRGGSIDPSGRWGVYTKDGNIIKQLLPDGTAGGATASALSAQTLTNSGADELGNWAGQDCHACTLGQGVELSTGSTPLNAGNRSQQILITNKTNGTLHFGTPSLSPGSSQFSLVGARASAVGPSSCTHLVLRPRANCAITVSFDPRAAGIVHGVLFPNIAELPGHTVALTGRGSLHAALVRGLTLTARKVTLKRLSTLRLRLRLTGRTTVRITLQRLFPSRVLAMTSVPRLPRKATLRLPKAVLRHIKPGTYVLVAQAVAPHWTSPPVPTTLTVVK